MNIKQAPLSTCTLENGERGFEVTIQFPMDLPSKKNNLVRRAHAKGNLVYTEETVAAMRAAELLASTQWGRSDKLSHPEVLVTMRIANLAKDPDGIWTTIADALKKGGVIVDDSIRHFNGWKHFAPVTVCQPRDECVTVRLRFAAPSDRLVNDYIRQEDRRA